MMAFFSFSGSTQWIIIVCSYRQWIKIVRISIFEWFFFFRFLSFSCSLCLCVSVGLWLSPSVSDCPPCAPTVLFLGPFNDYELSVRARYYTSISFHKWNIDLSIRMRKSLVAFFYLVVFLLLLLLISYE